MSTYLSVQGISKTFESKSGQVQALAPVSFELRRNEFVSIVGPSGCGKSTLFNVIAGLESPTTGSLQLEGQSIHDLKGKVAYQLQRDLLLPWRTILENVTLALEIRGVPTLERNRRGLDALNRYGLGQFANRYPRELSGGMRQRAAIIRTLLFDRDLILLDEPFGALDSQTRMIMQAWLLSVYAASSKTVLLITHDVEEAVLLSNRVLVMTSRPGSIKGEVQIDLDWPRTEMTLLTEKFFAFKKQITTMIRDESQRSFDEQLGSVSTAPVGGLS